MRSTIPNQIAAGTIPTPRIHVIQHAGVDIALYSIGWLTYWTKLAAVTLRLWQRQKLLPAPVFSIGDGARWYTAREIITYSGIIQAHYQDGRDRVALKKGLHAAFIKLKTEYKELNALNRKNYPADYFRLPSEQDHVNLLLHQQQTARREKKRLLGTAALKVARHYNEDDQKSTSVHGGQNHPQSEHQAVPKLPEHGGDLRRRA